MGEHAADAAEIARAHQLLELGRPAQALEIASLLLAAEPGSGAALRLAARSRTELGDDAGGLAAARLAVAADPESEYGFRVLAEALRRTRDHHGAVAAAREAVRLAPAGVRPHLQLAQCLYRVDAVEALAEAERSCMLGPEVAGAHYLRGAILKRLKRFDEARAAYAQALRIDPQYSAAMTAAALLDRGPQAWRGRLRGLQRALGASPQSVPSRLALEGVILTRLWRIGALALACVQILSYEQHSSTAVRVTAPILLATLAGVLGAAFWTVRADLGRFGWRLLRTDRRALICEAVVAVGLGMLGGATLDPGLVAGLPYTVLRLAMLGGAVAGMVQSRRLQAEAVRNPDML